MRRESVGIAQSHFKPPRLTLQSCREWLPEQRPNESVQGFLVGHGSSLVVVGRKERMCVSTELFAQAPRFAGTIGLSIAIKSRRLWCSGVSSARDKGRLPAERAGVALIRWIGLG